MRVLVIDDDKLIRKTVSRKLKEAGDYIVFEASSFAEANLVIERQAIDLAFIDMDLGDPRGLSGPKILRDIRKTSPSTVVIILTGIEDPSLIEDALKNGASEYLFKPFEESKLHQSILKAQITHRLFRENRSLRAQLQEKSQGSLFFESKSPKMKTVLEKAKKLQGKDLNILITGETGVGKEVMARFIWNLENDSSRPFVPLNCGAIPSNLVESEFFGHRKGAFTGATDVRVGKFESADGGDIFLDEIGMMPLDVQVKVLRTLNDGEVTPVGSNKSKHCKFRVIAATNESLEDMVKDQRFREDLHFRLKSVQLHIPPLRERKEDIEDLIQIFLTEKGHSEKSLSEEALEFCKSYHWQGNIRELRNVIQTAAELSNQTEVSLQDLTSLVSSPTSSAQGTPTLPGLRIEAGKFNQASREFEQQWVEKALNESLSLSEAARYLGVARSTLRSKLKEWGWRGVRRPID